MSNPTRTWTRRQILMAAAVAAAAPLGSMALRGLARADELPPLTATDPMAIAFGYHEDATTVDPEKYPKRSGEDGAKMFCHTCQYFGDPSAPRSTCALIPGKTVANGGWCTAWAPRPAA